MNIVGLGGTGCNIAKRFIDYPQYEVYLINTEEEQHKNFFHMPEYDSHEEYEEKCPSLSKFFKRKKKETIFILSSSGTISGSGLKILESLKKTKITVVLVIPELSELDQEQRLQHNAVFNVLQEYARSGIFEEIIFVSNSILENIIPDLTLLNKYDKINESISYSLHMLNFYNNANPVLKTKYKNKPHTRLCTIGTYDFEKNEEKLFFLLDNHSEKSYCIAIPQEKLEKDTELNKILKENMNSIAINEKTNVSYSIYSNDKDYSLGFVTCRSHVIQE